MSYVFVLLMLAKVSLQRTIRQEADTYLSHPDALATGYVRRGLKGVDVSVGYGAGFTYKVPVGSSDALPFLNQALKAVAAAKGGTITIGPGTFILGNAFVVTGGNMLIKGAGIGKTILKLKDRAPVFKQAGFLRARGVNDVTVTDLTLDGNKAKQVNNDKDAYGRYGIFMSNYKNWKFQRVEVQNFQRYGFDPHGIKDSEDPKSKANIWSYGLTIVDCVSHDNNWDGFTLDQTYNVYCANNIAYNNGRYGFNVVTAARNVVVENNIARNNGFGPRTPLWLSDGGDGCGYVADTNKPGFDTYNVTFRGNTAEKSFRAGFCVKDSGRIFINGNTVIDAPACANFKRIKAPVEFKNNKCIKTPKLFTTDGGPGAQPILTGTSISVAAANSTG